MSARDFRTDFLLPAISGLSRRHAARVAMALDAAIAFGALEHADGNESLQCRELVEAKYRDNVARLGKGGN